MTIDNSLPLSIRDVGPSPDAIRLTGVRPDGLPDGTHTGGAWLLDGMVFKPLDGRPYANCENHYPTREAECLEQMAGIPLFPRNWHIEEQNGRRFLVRKQAYTIPEQIDYKALKHEQVLMIEQGVRGLNRAKWEINDFISLAIDPDSYEIFLLDLSAAQAMNGTGCYRADDEWRVHEFFKLCGEERLIDFRQNASRVLHKECWNMYHPGYHHVYASFSRPISGLWARIPGAPEYVHESFGDWNNSTPWTWIITKEPLSQEILDRYELEWGWSPIHDA